jgi:hypothetical protein
LSQNTFEVRFIGPLRFQNVYHLNNCLMSEISDSQKVQGLANMAGNSSSQPNLAIFPVTIFEICGLALSC